MILAYHAIFSTYGFWLPNDPRGSWSDYIRHWELLRFGPATKTTLRRSLARDEHDIHARLEAKETLQHPPVLFTGEQALAVARGFAHAGAEAGYVFHACSILPEHVHLVVARHERPIERIVAHLKAPVKEGKPVQRWSFVTPYGETSAVQAPPLNPVNEDHPAL